MSDNVGEIAARLMAACRLIDRWRGATFERRSSIAQQHGCSMILVDRVIMLLGSNYAPSVVQEIAAVALLLERMTQRPPDNRQFWDTVYAVQARHAPPLTEEEYP